ncbi:YjbH domain-containing protein (plasmid) [Leisingera sp. S132]|uniref:YjbH domain-containing protein n=1 Tax=Leisingera sp. S132 TaxID=2867016 RepID=UPI0021A488C4|nr:YjbH domain-containing protein [Leisingera sp. S132]UWQ81913.1 YjbH domain-containing protein [Leisingera sp. S132]
MRQRILQGRHLLLAALVLTAPAAVKAQTTSNYGTPGLIETPSAEMYPDGTLAFTSGMLDRTLRATMTFQMLPWVHGSFRYAVIEGFDGQIGDRFDRSFDLHFLLREESRTAPALALGLRDFGGTGIYASEYLAATKTFRERLKLSGGIGWGRMAGRGSFSNPLGGLSDRFKTRPDASAGGISTTGQLDFGNWFRGDAALFGGVSWAWNDQLTLLAEYSPDLYSQERDRIGFEAASPFNFGARYRFENGTQLTASYMYGTTFGLSYSYFIDPRQSVAPGGQGAAAPPLLPAGRVALASWNLPDDPAAPARRQQVLAQKLQQEGLRLVYLETDGDSLRIGVENSRYGQAAQAIGRTARVLANTQPAQVQGFDIALMAGGVPLSSVRIARNDLYELEHDLDGAWRSFARAEVSDSISLVKGGFTRDAYPHFSYRFGPYLQASFFDPDAPFRYEIGAQLGLDYTLSPGLSLSAGLRQPAAGNLDDSQRRSNSVIQRVRSDWGLYAQQSDLRIEHLTAEYIWRPGENLYARATLGYLETMYGGLSGEILWFPANSRLALGAELNYVRQRDFDVLFGFQDYATATGHVSAYYDLPGEYHAQVDAGRYLAGDYGATLTLDREFANGFKVGAFFTLTTVSFDDFGEGSFDKGIRLEIPVSWLTGRPSRDRLAQVIRPVLRDGGARLNVRNRLYGVTREARAQQLVKGWGRFMR